MGEQDKQTYTQDDFRRRGVIGLGPSLIAELLGLPEGWHVVGVHGEFAPNRIEVAVISKDLPKVSDDEEAPLLSQRAQIVKSYHDGRMWMRLEWPDAQT